MINNYMQPMAASGRGPAGPDMGGMLMQGINAWQGMKRADLDATRHQALIDALRGNGMGDMWGGTGAGSGWGAQTMPTQGMPPMMGFE